MLNKKGKKELSYNAQLVVDKNGLIIASDVVRESDDRNQLVPGINQVEENFGQLPEGTIVSADGGFENGPALAELEERGFDLYVLGKGMTKNLKKFAKANFSYDEEKDEYICPEGKILTKRGTSIHFQKQVPSIRYAAELSDCQACPHQQACCKNLKKRSIDTLPQDALFHRIKKKLKTDEGKAIYGLRKQTVERSFGDIKENKKFRGFLLRGLEKVKIEFNLTCLAHNLVMINNLLNKREGLVSC